MVRWCWSHVIRVFVRPTLYWVPCWHWQGGRGGQRARWVELLSVPERTVLPQSFPGGVMRLNLGPGHGGQGSPHDPHIQGPSMLEDMAEHPACACVCHCTSAPARGVPEETRGKHFVICGSLGSEVTSFTSGRGHGNAGYGSSPAGWGVKGRAAPAVNGGVAAGGLVPPIPDAVTPASLSLLRGMNHGFVCLCVCS